jgi:hypothetical protein
MGAAAVFVLKGEVGLGRDKFSKPLLQVQEYRIKSGHV